MINELRKPVFVLALILMGIIVISEAGSAAILGMQSSEAARAIAETGAAAPGIGIPYLAVFDILVMFSVSLMGVSLIIPERVQARVQGIITLVVSVIIFFVSMMLIVMTLGKIFLMLGLLLAPIFGTIAYMAIYGHFDTVTARVTLGFIMSLKFAFAVLLIVSHQRFLENKGLVMIILSSLLATLIVSICHGIVLGFLVSITDSVAALIVLIITLVWALVFLAGSIKSVIKAIA